MYERDDVDEKKDGIDDDGVDDDENEDDDEDEPMDTFLLLFFSFCMGHVSSL